MPQDGEILGYYVRKVSASDFEVRRIVQAGEFADDGGLYCTCTTRTQANDEKRELTRLMRQEVSRG